LFYIFEIIYNLNSSYEEINPIQSRAEQSRAELRLGIILSMSFLLLPLQVFSQQSDFNDNYLLKEQFTVEETTRVLPPSKIHIDSINAIDKMYFKERKTIKHITNTIDKNGKMLSTIIIERPSHIEKWIEYPAKIVTSEDEITTYDSYGKKISEFVFDSKQRKERQNQKDKIKSSGKFQDVSFQGLSNKEIAEITKNKGKYKKLSYYSEEIEFDSVKIRNVPEKYIKQTIFKSNQSGEFYTSSKFNKTEDGDFYKENETSQNYSEIRFSVKNHTAPTKEISNIKTTKYTLYKDARYKKAIGRERENLDFMQIMENPVMGDWLGLAVKVNGDYRSDQILILNITDLLGRTILKPQINLNQEYHSIDISSLSAGQFMLNFSTVGNQTKNLKFIKI
jgi:hypothetical protein